jgi:hypothetical protein
MTHEPTNPPHSGIQRFDAWDRWWVPSHQNPKERYLCILTDYHRNGSCCCKNFKTKLGPILNEGLTPEQAVANGRVRLKERQRPADALRCKHLIELHAYFADLMVEQIEEKLKAAKPQEPPCYGRNRVQ